MKFELFKEPIMISRLTAFGVIFAVVTTATLAFAASSENKQASVRSTATVMLVYQLERVVVTGKRVSKPIN
jgi:hypothetical protein